MSIKDANIALISTIPESEQQQIYLYLSAKCGDSPFKPLSANEIFAELAESRACFERGEYEDFDDALDEISVKYGI